MASRGLVLLAASLAAIAGCTSSNDRTPAIASSTTIAAPAPGLTDGALVGVSGTVRSSNPPDDFTARVAAASSRALEHLDDVVAAYDTVTITALAAVVAKSDAPARIGANVAAITTGRNRCPGFRRCRSLIDEGDPIAYVGPAGDVQMTPYGTPRAAQFDTVTFNDRDGLDTVRSLRTSMPDDVQAVSPGGAVVRPPNGTLTLGTLMPTIGPRAAQGAAQLIGVRMAVADINEAFGVLGRDVEVLNDSARGGSPQEIVGAVQRMADAGADVLIGSTDSATTAAALPTVRAKGLMLFSPSDGGTTLLPPSTLPDDNSLFFTTKPLDRLQAEALARSTQQDGAAKVALVREVGGVGAELATSLGVLIGFADGRSFADAPADTAAAAVNAAVVAAPDAVIITGTDSFQVAAIRGTRTALPTAKIYVADISVGLARAWADNP